ncbi:hypothetical protein BKI51_02585 [Alphaproteobacteria bacterium AO1-B]|nr:hypothetical protein BKI51_02585 [Alphaproteobacteria bacterium AO1-B]
MQMFNCLKIGLVIAVISQILGCANAGLIGGKELSVFKELSSEGKLQSITGFSNYAEELATIYIQESDGLSIAQDAVALGIIGAAATSAGGLLYGASTDLIKGAGLAAGTAGALTTYVGPKESSIALLNAADQMLCISRAGRVADTAFGKGKNTDQKSEQILDTAIRQSRLKLRKALAKQLPDYSDVVNSIKDSAESQVKLNRIHGTEDGSVENIRIVLQASVDKCLLIPQS